MGFGRFASGFCVDVVLWWLLSRFVGRRCGVYGFMLSLRYDW